MAERSKVLIVVETSAGKVRDGSLELISAANELADSQSIGAVVLGSDVEDVASDVASRGVGDVFVVNDPALERYTTHGYAAGIEAAIESLQPEIVLLSGTTAGRDLGPYLAAKRGQEALVDCISIRQNDGSITGTRPVFQGKMLTDVEVSGGEPYFVVTRNGAFAIPDATETVGNVQSLEVKIDAGPVELVGLSQPKAGSAGLEDADVVICGGRGVGSEENFAMLNQLAEAFGGAVGATRAVTDLGWRPHHEQIGQTGANVRPKLYIGIGVSGAVQHLVGMQNAETIVAINRDPDAPLFRLAEIGVVGDLHEIVPALLKRIEAVRSGAA